jgi:hypothetical protein
MIDKCRHQGLCPKCGVGRYRGDDVACYNCGSTDPERKTVGKLCFEQCAKCRTLDEAEAKKP